VLAAELRVAERLLLVKRAKVAGEVSDAESVFVGRLASVADDVTVVLRVNAVLPLVAPL
jgi:hypothetical protein